jgi:2-(3-amino-3-carboxypropyl)histidine synthase
MKKLFIEAKSKADVKKAVEKAVKLLPKRVGVVTTAQHKHKLKEIKQILEKNKIKAEIGGQILGCDASAAKKIKDKVDGFLYVGSGRFHPIGVYLESKKKVVMANPLTDEAKELEQSEVDRILKMQQGALAKFLTAENIGILVSLKPGQNRLKQAIKLKENFKNKKTYIFIADTIDLNELENFPFIESWVNTACPRISDKTLIVNYDQVKKYVR